MVQPAAAQRPFVAGMYDYYLGGTANSAVDRATVDQILAVLPEMREAAWANRGFLQRAVKRMVTEWGIRQFIDLGAGLPTQRHTHEVVAESIDDGRVVYVDNDPQVIERGQQLLAGVDGAVAILGDIRQPAAVLDDPQTRRLIDFSQPVGLLMVAVTQFIADADGPYQIVGSYLDAVPSGSYLAVAAPTGDHQSERIVERVRQLYARTPTPGQARTLAEVARFFEGLEIVAPYPGAQPEVTFVGQWGAEDPEAADDESSRWFYAAVARKP